MKHHFALLGLAGPLLGLAQPAHQATGVASPDVPVPAVIYQPLPPATGAGALVQQQDDWKAANATVGQYRGHSGIVRWERAQQAGRPPAGPDSTHDAAPQIVQEPVR